MLRHLVLTKFKAEVTEAEIVELYQGFASVTTRLEGASNFVGGRSTSPEKIERGYMHAFSIDFDDATSLQRYSDDAEHKRLGAELTQMAEGNRDGLLVLDIEF